MSHSGRPVATSRARRRPRALVALVALLLAAPAATVAAQDTATMGRGAVLRLSIGRIDVTRIAGRLDASDDLAIRLMVAGDEGDQKLRADRVGATAMERGVADSQIISVPWRLVRAVDVAAGRRSRRLQNGLLGGMIGTGIGGGVGAVLGATVARSTCESNNSPLCGISPDAGRGAAIGAVTGLLIGAVWGAARESWATIWTPLPDRGGQLRVAPPAP